MSKTILNKLVDKFERSKQKENIHISILLTKQVLPEYFDLNSEQFETINEELIQAEKRGLISLDWKDNRPGHIIKRIRLIPNSVDKLYIYLDRKPKSYQVEKIINNLEKELKNYSDSVITRAFIEFLIDKIAKGKSVSEYLDLNNYVEFSKFLNVLYRLEKNEELLYLREFSGKVTGDTKYIERNLSKIINIIYKFSDLFDKKDSELILNYFNIYRNPIFVFLKGNIQVLVNSESLNLSKLSNGIALSSQDLRNLQINNIDNVITIENLTTYNRFPNLDKTLIAYSRGFANSELISLLKKIKENNTNCNFYHFGDIDIGGFLILIDLIQKTGIDFKPLYMDGSILSKYLEYSKPLTVNDKKRLNSLIDSIELSEINKDIQALIKESLTKIKNYEAKLEQEVINFNLEMLK